MPREPEIRMSAIVPEHQRTHFIPNNPIKKMIGKHPEPRAANVILEISKARWIDCDPVLCGLYLREKPVPELGAPSLSK